MKLNDVCHANCSCTNNFQPVCSHDNTVMYYSPCYAGCSDVLNYTKTKEGVNLVRLIETER